MGLSPGAVTSTFDIAPVSSKEFLDILATTECGFTLKHICDMIRTYSEMHHTDKYSWHTLIMWPIWLSGWFNTQFYIIHSQISTDMTNL